MDTKTFAGANIETKIADAEQGIVETLVSVTGIEDAVGDIIVPGAYEKTLSERTPLGVWSHDWDTPVSVPLEIKELHPLDPALPAEIRDGVAWPAEAGALYVKAQYNLNTQAGRDAFEWAKFLQSKQGWSIGYAVPAGASEIKDRVGGKGKVRHLKTVELFEYSQVLHGAQPVTNGARLLDIKDVRDHYAEFPAIGSEQAKAIEGYLAPAFDDDAELAQVRTFLKSRIDPNLDPSAPEPVIYSTLPGVDHAGADEAKSYHSVSAVISGTIEEHLSMVSEAVHAQSGGTMWVAATFADRVIVRYYDERTDEMSTMEIPYTMDDDGVNFGEPVAVELVATIVEKSVEELIDEIAALRSELAELKSGTVAADDDGCGDDCECEESGGDSDEVSSDGDSDEVSSDGDSDEVSSDNDDVKAFLSALVELKRLG